MRARLFVLISMSCISTWSRAETNCTQRLLNQRLDNTIEVGAPADGMRTVKIRTNSGETVTCPPFPSRVERQILQHFDTLKTAKALSTDQLIGFVHAPWIPLSISAGRELIRRARYDRIAFQQQQLDRLAGRGDESTLSNW